MVFVKIVTQTVSEAAVSRAILMDVVAVEGVVDVAAEGIVMIVTLVVSRSIFTSIYSLQTQVLMIS